MHVLKRIKGRGESNIKVTKQTKLMKRKKRKVSCTVKVNSILESGCCVYVCSDGCPVKVSR